MKQQSATVPQIKAWLVSHSGQLVGIRHLIGETTTRVGRSPQNDVVIQGPDVACVSLQHLEIRREVTGFRIRDLGSTNGTYLNGERITEADLCAPATIRLGPEGPELAFIVEETATFELDRTLEIPKSILLPQLPPAPVSVSGSYEALLSEAVARARRARSHGFGNQTMTIMRDTLDQALRHTSRRFRMVIGVLVAGIVAISGCAAWKISEMKREKHSLDRQIQQIEARLQKVAGRPAEADQLITQLDVYQDQAEQLQRNLLYRIGVREKEGFLTQEIRTLMAEFGAEVYSIPPEFSDRVDYYVEQYQGSDRPLMMRALSLGVPQFKIMRRVLEEEQLPPDLAYIPLVESALGPDRSSAAGAAGPWQFTPATARAYGLRVDKELDERLDLVKATRAGCRYLRELILDFGSGSSVMLALAAYNLGPSKVKRAVMRTVRDPIKQRNFWYLYRVQALPNETREYVPKVMAAIIIGRNPRRFGF